MRRRWGVLVALVATAALVVPIGTAAAGTAQPDRSAGVARPVTAVEGTGEFVVFYADGVSAAGAHAAIAAAGGTLVDEIAALGIARVTTDNARFAQQLRAPGTCRAPCRVGGSGRCRAPCRIGGSGRRSGRPIRRVQPTVRPAE
jgi:hypothetical protein